MINQPSRYLLVRVSYFTTNFLTFLARPYFQTDQEERLEI